jgi:hypothetical protein
MHIYACNLIALFCGRLCHDDISFSFLASINSTG